MTTDTMTVELAIPAQWATELADPLTLLEILKIGVEEYRLRRALALYTEGIGSLGYVAEQAEIPVRVLMEEARRRGVLPLNDDELIAMDLAQ